jgi:HK97 family phage portal protein
MLMRPFVQHGRQETRAITIGAGSLEQPSESLVLGLGGAMPSSSGVAVTQKSAEGIPTVYACNRVISQDIAKTPIKLKRRNADGTRADDVNHAVYHCLHDLFNPTTTSYEGKETLQTYLNYWGNAFAEIIRKPGEVQLWPLDSARMSWGLDGLNRLTYSYRMLSGPPKVWIFDPANPPIFHLRQNSRDGITGRSPVTVLREAMGTTVAQDRYVSRLYGQGGHPRVALSTSQKLNEASARRIRSDFETLTVGEHNWHRVVVLDHDLKPVPLVMPNRDAQFLELTKLSDQRLCGAFRVSPHKISNDERSTFSNVEQIAIEHVGDCLMPHFVCWQQAIGRDLLNPKSFNTHFAVFIVDSLLRGDAVAVNTMLNLQRQNGVINANQWRKTLDMDDQISDEDGGNEYLVNGTMMPMHRDPAAAIELPLPVPQGGAN